jgi:hypothetical protein
MRCNRCGEKITMASETPSLMPRSHYQTTGATCSGSFYTNDAVRRRDNAGREA